MNMGANAGYSASNPTQSGTVGNPMAAIGDVGYINPGGSVAQTGRPSVGMGKQPSWGDVTSGLDKDFWSAMGGSMGSGPEAGSLPDSVNAGNERQFKVQESKFLPVSPMAPNPGWEQVLARKKQNRYSGGF